MKISGLPLEALLFKLRASGTGFNDNLAAVVASYGTKAFTIDWPADPYQKGTKNFIIGKVPPEEVDSFGITGITKASMFVDRTDNQNFEKPNNFSGSVKVGLDFHLGYLSSDMAQNFETLMMAVEDAVTQVIQPDFNQFWGGGVNYDGKFSAIRGMVNSPAQGQGALRQLLAFRFDFIVDV